MKFVIQKSLPRMSNPILGKRLASTFCPLFDQGQHDIVKIIKCLIGPETAVHIDPRCDAITGA